MQQAAEQQLRDERLQQGVQEALGRVRGLQQEGRLAAADVLLTQAQQRLGEEGRDDLKDQIEAVRADLDLQVRLDAIRLAKVAQVGGRLDEAGAVRAYASALSHAGVVREGESSAVVAQRVRRSAITAALLTALDDWASVTDRPDQQTWLLEIARQADPNPWRDRIRDAAVWKDPAALEKVAAEVPVAELSPQLLLVLATRLRKSGKDALPLLRPGLAQYPQDFWLIMEMGGVLSNQSSPDAPGYYRAALTIRPGSTVVYNNLGLSLLALRRYDEALAELERAVALDARNPRAYVNIALVLRRTDRREAALEKLDQAIGLGPDLPEAHYNKGLVLQELKRLEEAIPAYRRAVALDSQFALAHNNFGNVFKALGRLDDAIEEYRQAIAIDARNFLPHYNLGNALKAQHKWDEAVAAYVEATRLAPNRPEPHGELADTLLLQGKFAAALEASRSEVALVPADHPVARVVAARLQECQRLVGLDGRLAAVLRGAEPASAADRLELASFCRRSGKRLHVAAAGFYADSFAAEPKLAADLDSQHRYNAACSAALAGCGRGDDAARLDDKERARLRQQALDWLKADLVLWEKVAANTDPKACEAVQKQMKRWQEETDLACVRDADILTKLPESERDAWQKLWDAVAAVLKKSAETK